MADYSPSYLTEQLFYRFEPEGTGLFAVLDGARNPEIHRQLQLSALEYESLFSGQLSAELRAVSPFVVRLLPQDAITQFLVDQGWGKDFGIFVAWQAGLGSLRRHLRTLLRVRTEGGKKLYFRFYDPRVLRAMLPTCSPEQLRDTFGAIRRIDMESATGRELVRFRLSQPPFTLQRWQHDLNPTERQVLRDAAASTLRSAC